jgi:hypothetical protein
MSRTFKRGGERCKATSLQQNLDSVYVCVSVCLCVCVSVCTACLRQLPEGVSKPNPPVCSTSNFQHPYAWFGWRVRGYIYVSFFNFVFCTSVLCQFIFNVSFIANR